MPQLSASVITLVLKYYTEQGLRSDGLSVDNLAYSKNIKEIVDSVNRDPDTKQQVGEQDVYSLLLFLRKTRKLPKLFRAKELC